MVVLIWKWSTGSYHLKVTKWVHSFVIKRAYVRWSEFKTENVCRSEWSAPPFGVLHATVLQGLEILLATFSTRNAISPTKMMTPTRMRLLASSFIIGNTFVFPSGVQCEGQDLKAFSPKVELKMNFSSWKNGNDQFTTVSRNGSLTIFVMQDLLHDDLIYLVYYVLIIICDCFTNLVPFEWVGV